MHTLPPVGLIVYEHGGTHYVAWYGGTSHALLREQVMKDSFNVLFERKQGEGEQLHALIKEYVLECEARGIEPVFPQDLLLRTKPAGYREHSVRRGQISVDVGGPVGNC